MVWSLPVELLDKFLPKFGKTRPMIRALERWSKSIGSSERAMTGVERIAKEHFDPSQMTFTHSRYIDMAWQFTCQLRNDIKWSSI
ncbi:hypothetical protein M7I_6525 [Glarea lozoyensis 74030]|uniref:Uncharacterized protein n=1 Tax=Glarea lozoyensis (strain ATCC 74030 / MF5533) TaxID=1104152 RepID=H0EUT6_GLAL7|nr:hypothetical protein M7I_6525 [Glarea lozoyensis 74030]